MTVTGKQRIAVLEHTTQKFKFGGDGHFLGTILAVNLLVSTDNTSTRIEAYVLFWVNSSYVSSPMQTASLMRKNAQHQLLRAFCLDGLYQYCFASHTEVLSLTSDDADENRQRQRALV